MSEQLLPPLAEFLRWLAEMPPAFKATPAGFKDGAVRVDAVVTDLAETLLGGPPPAGVLENCVPARADRNERNRLRWLLAACHLLWHPELRQRPCPPEGLRRLLVDDLAALAAVEPVDSLLTDEERREELVRLALRALDLRLPGESAGEAEDRLTQVDSVERRRVLKEAAERERRAREVREALLAQQAAQEAAARYGGD
jgi:hypothetical protein